MSDCPRACPTPARLAPACLLLQSGCRSRLPPVLRAVRNRLRGADTLSTRPNPSGSKTCRLYPSLFMPRLTSPTTSLRWIRVKRTNLKSAQGVGTPIGILRKTKSDHRRAQKPGIKNSRAVVAQVSQSGEKTAGRRVKKSVQKPGKTGVKTGKRGWEAGRRQEENDGQLGMGSWLPAAGPWSGC